MTLAQHVIPAVPADDVIDDCSAIVGPVGLRHREAVLGLVLPRLHAALEAYERAIRTELLNEPSAMAALQDFGNAIVALVMADRLMRCSAGTAGEA